MLRRYDAGTQGGGHRPKKNFPESIPLVSPYYPLLESGDRGREKRAAKDIAREGRKSESARDG
jgi:hypothetical protein